MDVIIIALLLGLAIPLSLESVYDRSRLRGYPGPSALAGGLISYKYGGGEFFLFCVLAGLTGWYIYYRVCTVK